MLFPPLPSLSSLFPIFLSRALSYPIHPSLYPCSVGRNVRVFVLAIQDTDSEMVQQFVLLLDFDSSTMDLALTTVEKQILDV